MFNFIFQNHLGLLELFKGQLQDTILKAIREWQGGFEREHFGKRFGEDTDMTSADAWFR
jgi:hypothetical protein